MGSGIPDRSIICISKSAFNAEGNERTKAIRQQYGITTFLAEYIR